MKIMLINTLYPPYFVGGAEISVQILAETLVEYGNEVVVIASSPKSKAIVKKINNVKVYFIPLRNIYWPFKDKQNEIKRLFWHIIDIYNPLMANQLAKIMRKENPDLIHTNNLSGFSVATYHSAKIANIPILHTVRDFYLICHNSNMFRKQQNCNNQCYRCKLFGFVKKIYSNSVDAVVGISRFILSTHLENGYFRKVRKKAVVYNPIIKIGNNSILNNRSKIKLGFLGKISQMKGIELLLREFCGFSDHKYELHIAGKGEQEYVNYLRCRYKKNIYFHGFFDSSAFLERIDLLIVPSLWNEPLGRTIIEAYSSGIPVIGSNRGAIPEIIKNGITGCIFDPSKNGDLMKKIFSIAENPEKMIKIKKNCIEEAKLFTPDRIAKQYMALYKDILN